MSSQKRVFIIHGWDGYPEEGIFPWLKKELQGKDFAVFNPLMPEPLKPQIDAWVSFLRQQIGVPDKDTILFGHSIGAQTILRYLESLKENESIGGAVFLAGWVHLTDKAYETDEDPAIAKPWLETPLNWAKIKSHSDKFIAIFSDDDPLVPISDAKIFERELGAKIIIEKKKAHFSGSSGIQELSSALEAIMEITEERSL
jgi:predicted alpha/beta hydrolase family esterase